MRRVQRGMFRNEESAEGYVLKRDRDEESAEGYV